MKHFKTILLAVILFAAAGIGHMQESLPEAGTLIVDGVERTFQMTLPSESGDDPMPVLIVLHGAGGSGMEMVLASGFAEMSTFYNTLVIYPNGHNNRFYYHAMYDGQPAPVDDVAFIQALLDYAEENYNVDPNRFYVVGFSNGGMMTVRLRCALADRLAGVAVLGATMSIELAQTCVEESMPEPVSFALVLGNQDERFPWNGLMQVQDGQLTGTFSASQTLSFMASLNTCEAATETVDVTAPTSIIQVIRQRVPQCANDTEILFYAMPGMGHAWPVPAFINLGDGTGTLHDGVWAFFAAHSREN